MDERTWIVRFHLVQGDQITKVTVDNNELMIHKDATEREGLHARLLEPSNNEKRMVFLGKGEAPPQEAGSILEVLLPSYNVQKEVAIRVEQ